MEGVKAGCQAEGGEGGGKEGECRVRLARQLLFLLPGAASASFAVASLLLHLLFISGHLYSLLPIYYHFSWIQLD